MFWRVMFWVVVLLVPGGVLLCAVVAADALRRERGLRILRREGVRAELPPASRPAPEPLRL